MEKMSERVRNRMSSRSRGVKQVRANQDQACAICENSPKSTASDFPAATGVSSRAGCCEGGNSRRFSLYRFERSRV